MHTPPSEVEILSELTGIFHDAFDNDSLVITPETTAKDIAGWDSYTHINLIVAAESKFKIKFKTSEIESLRNVAHFVEVIQSKLSQ